jgi:hypothetical protein
MIRMIKESEVRDVEIVDNWTRNKDAQDKSRSGKQSPLQARSPAQVEGNCRGPVNRAVVGTVEAVAERCAHALSGLWPPLLTRQLAPFPAMACKQAAKRSPTARQVCAEGEDLDLWSTENAQTM